MSLVSIPATESQREVDAWRQEVVRAIERPQRARVRTIDATPTALHTVQLDLSTLTLFEFLVVARQIGGSGGTVGDSAAWDGWALYKMVGVTATLIGSVQLDEQGKDNAAITLGLAQSENRVQWVVTGDTNTDYTWVMHVNHVSSTV